MRAAILVLALPLALALNTAYGRRSVVSAAAAALVTKALPPRLSRAEYGESAGIKAPAFVPSPIRPTGKMAETCEVVALGREDVCLEYKKVLTAYDTMKLADATQALDALIGSPSAAAVRPALEAVRALVPLVETGRLAEVQATLKAGLVGPDESLGDALKRVAAGDAARGENRSRRTSTPYARRALSRWVAGASRICQPARTHTKP